VIAGALVCGVTAGVTGAAMMLADAVAAGQGNGYGYAKGKAADLAVHRVGRKRE
jgi:hypothetical protein